MQDSSVKLIWHMVLFLAGGRASQGRSSRDEEQQEDQEGSSQCNRIAFLCSYNCSYPMFLHLLLSIPVREN